MLIQTTENLSSRFYLNYTNKRDALVGIIIITSIAIFEIYEQLLKRKKPNEGTLTYNLEDVIEFVKNLKEAVMLEYSVTLKGFIPHGKEWITWSLALEFLKDP